MCKYSILSQTDKGFVRYCYDCHTYSIVYENILMNFDDKGFQNFKSNVSQCYVENVKDSYNPKRRDIFFNTRVDGLQFIFSVEEVGEILSLMQTAELESMHLLGTEQDN